MPNLFAADGGWSDSIESADLGLCSAANCVLRIRAKPGAAVQQMLGRIVRRIPDEWLWIDNEPRLSMRTKDVSRVQVCREQRVRGGALRQVIEEAKTLTNEVRIWPVLGLPQRLVGPVRCHLGEPTKGMRRNGYAPDSTQEPRDYDILLGFRQRA
jgi:hypothetical protein